MVDLTFLIKIYFGELLLSVITIIGSLPLSILNRRQEEVKTGIIWDIAHLATSTGRGGTER